MGALGCASTPSAPPRPQVTIPAGFNANLYSRVAVYSENLTRTRLSDGALRMVEDEFLGAALQRGYAVVARTDWDRVLQEQRLQRSGVTEVALARAGRALNVPGIIIVTINSISVERDRTYYGETYYRGTVNMSARLLDVELVQVRWLASFVGRANINARNEPEAAVSWVARVLATGIPVRR